MPVGSEGAYRYARPAFPLAARLDEDVRREVTEEMSCSCAARGYVRSLEEDDFGFPDKIETLAETDSGLLGRCRTCDAWWERLPHWVYGYAWYRTERAYWGGVGQDAVAAWREGRREVAV
jgi:hypothetical protein